MSQERQPTDAQVHAATIRELQRIPELHARARQIRLGFARPGTRESVDRKSPVGEYPSSIATLKIGVAGDHLLALYNATHREGQPWLLPTWAHFTLLRAAIEASVEARWLTDRDVTSVIRLARGVDRMLYDLEERAKAEAVIVRLKAVPADLTLAVDRIAQLNAEAHAAGIARAGHPGTTQLVRDFATCGEGFDEYLFRFSSGVLHGVAWATVWGAEKLGDLDADIAVVQSTADPMNTWYLTRCALRHFTAAIATLEAYVTP